jgi:hypothetical protein
MSGKLSRHHYPPQWGALSQFVRFERAQGQCECMGECGLHRTNPGPRRCVERHGQPAVWAKGRVILTTAHLCHNPACDDLEHLRAMCNRCHLRYDQALHARHAAETRRMAREAAGQLSLIQKGAPR